MEGFVNSSINSPFDYGLKHSKSYANYGYDKTFTKDEIKQHSIQQNQPNNLLGLSQQTYGAYQNNLLNLSLPDNLDETIVDTVTTPNQNTHQRLKTLGIIGASVLLLGGLTMFYSKGKLSKGIIGFLGKISDNATKKIEEIKQKPKISNLEGTYLNILQKTGMVADRMRGAFFNISPLKDVLFEKIVREKLGLNKVCDKITNGFRKVSFSTVKSSYKNAEKNINNMTQLFEETNQKLASGEFLSTKPSQDIMDKLNNGVSKIKTEYSKSFGESVVENREKSLVKKFNGLGKRIYDTVYGKIKDFVTDIDSMTTFISERFVAKDKAKIIEDLAAKRRVITNNPENNYNIMKDIISNLEMRINPENKGARDSIKQLKSLTEKYVSLSGSSENYERTKLISEINSQLKQAGNIIYDSTYSKKESLIIKSLISQYGKVINTDKKGAVEELLTIYKELLPPEEYAKIKASAQKATKSLNNAVHIEGFEYTDKIRDLSVGSALTDVAIGAGVPLITTGVAISAANTKQKKRSVALKYGLPLLAGIATTSLCTVKLISGGKSLMLGGVVSLIGNELFERLDNYLIEKDKKKLSQQN